MCNMGFFSAFGPSLWHPPLGHPFAHFLLMQAPLRAPKPEITCTAIRRTEKGYRHLDHYKLRSHLAKNPYCL